MILVPALFALVHFLVAGVAAQPGTNVTSCVPEFYWSVDDSGHTPCFTAAHLYTPCGITNKYLQAIPPRTWYLGPNSTYQDECGCSSAVYMLTSACGACQGRPWVNYTGWARECPEKLQYIGYPKEVPIGITLPEWAKANVSELADRSFDPAKAQIGEYPRNVLWSAAAEQATKSPLDSVTSQAPSVPTSETTSPPPLETTSNAGGSSHSSTGAIAGGVVGSLVALAALGLLIFWLILRKRTRAARELRAKALDLTEPEHESPHDSEKPPTAYFGNGNRLGGYAGGKDSPPPVSMVGGRSWHSNETKEWHRRQASSSSGGHGQGQGYNNASSIPGYHTTALSEDVAIGKADKISAPPPPIYTTHVRRPSADSFNMTVPLSAGSTNYSGLSGPGFAGNGGGAKPTTLLATGYTGVGEPT